MPRKKSDRILSAGFVILPERRGRLCIPYELDGEVKPTYPDFIVVRQDERIGYVIDILEPHSADFKDNLGKAKGFAEYARQNPGVGRIQLIRMGKDAAGRNQFRRLDMYKTAIREKGFLCDKHR